MKFKQINQWILLVGLMALGMSVVFAAEDLKSYQVDPLRKQYGDRNRDKTQDEKQSLLGVNEHRSPSLTTSSDARRTFAAGLVYTPQEIKVDFSKSYTIPLVKLNIGFENSRPFRKFITHPELISNNGLFSQAFMMGRRFTVNGLTELIQKASDNSRLLAISTKDISKREKIHLLDWCADSVGGPNYCVRTVVSKIRDEVRLEEALEEKVTVILEEKQHTVIEALGGKYHQINKFKEHNARLGN